MSFSLKIGTASFSNYVDKTVPYFSTAAGMWLLGGTDTASRTNLVTGALATVVGTPVLNTGYATLAMVNGYNTGLVFDKADPCTMIIVGSSAIVGYCGMAHDALAHTALSGASSTKAAAFTSSTGGSLQTIETFATSPSMTFKAGTVSGTAGVRNIYVQNGTSMLTNTITSVNTTGVTNTFNIGASGTTPTITFDCAAAMLWRTVLTAGQITEMYDYLKYKIGKRGVTVL